MAKKLTTKLLGKVAIDSGVILIKDGHSVRDYKKQIGETIEGGKHQVFNSFKSKGKTIITEVAVVAYSGIDGWKNVYGIFDGRHLKELRIII